MSLAQHVIFTKNQIFIFFLIPLVLGFAHNGLNNLNLNYKKFLSFILFFSNANIKKIIATKDNKAE